MIRNVIKIEEDKCIGCALCVKACHEGAIGIVNGKAKLLRDDYCDGLGNCLPVCPTDAISFEMREADEFDKAAVEENMKKAKNNETPKFTCPSQISKTLERPNSDEIQGNAQNRYSQLQQWPLQIKLVPINAPYFENANLLIAADCTAFAHGDFHNQFMRGKVTLIGCPKLDEGEYSEKLTAIIKTNNLKSVTVVRMEVPCCGGLENAVKQALKASGKFIPWQIVIITTDGKILD